MTKIHPYDMYRLIATASASDIVHIKDDGKAVTIKGIQYVASTDVPPTPEGIEAVGL